MMMCVSQGARTDFLGHSAPLRQTHGQASEKSALTTANFNEPQSFQFLVRLTHSVGIDTKIARKLTYRWKRVSRADRAHNYCASHFVHNLDVYRTRIRRYDGDQHE